MFTHTTCFEAFAMASGRFGANLLAVDDNPGIPAHRRKKKTDSPVLET